MNLQYIVLTGWSPPSIFHPLGRFQSPWALRSYQINMVSILRHMRTSPEHPVTRRHRASLTPFYLLGRAVHAAASIAAGRAWSHHNLHGTPRCFLLRPRISFWLPLMSCSSLWEHGADVGRSGSVQLASFFNCYVVQVRKSVNCFFRVDVHSSLETWDAVRNTKGQLIILPQVACCFESCGSFFTFAQLQLIIIRAFNESGKTLVVNACGVGCMYTKRRLSAASKTDMCRSVVLSLF